MEPSRMETASSTNSTDDGIVDSTPLLGNSNGNREDDRSRRIGRRPSLRRVARFFQRTSSRRMMREPSMLVRETAAEQLEERQSDWAYSRPIVLLDVIWNMTFVIVAIAVLILSRNESTPMPLRIWILGYALQCILHAVFVFVEYRRRYSRQRSARSESNGNENGGNSSSNAAEEARNTGSYPVESPQDEESTSVVKHLESANTMFSFIWWIIGFYWISAGGQEVTRDSPQLYWLCIVFLAFDVFFVVFCVALACIIGIAVCCCLPCIIAILYAVAEQEGASKEDIDQLPKYRFRKIGDLEKLSGEIQGPFGGIMTEFDTDSPIERVLPLEDAECCICLSAYEDGTELRELPCGHHFHCACIDKWLYINATCPLCKYNVVKSHGHHMEEV